MHNKGFSFIHSFFLKKVPYRWHKSPTCCSYHFVFSLPPTNHLVGTICWISSRTVLDYVLTETWLLFYAFIFYGRIVWRNKCFLKISCHLYILVSIKRSIVLGVSLMFSKSVFSHSKLVNPNEDKATNWRSLHKMNQIDMHWMYVWKETHHKALFRTINVLFARRKRSNGR